MVGGGFGLNKNFIIKKGNVQISIVILNWNTTDLLQRLICSLVTTTCLSYRIIIHDNGSCKSEYSKLIQIVSEYKNINLFKSDINLGFAAGNNQALTHLLYDDQYIVFINSDIIVKQKNWDIGFLDYLQQENVGIVGCAYHPLTWDRLGNFFIHPSSVATESQTVQGAFFATKKTILDQLFATDGFYFDEGFKYAHYEEADLQLRIMKLGYKCWWLPIDHIHDHNNSATKKNGYHLNNEIMGVEDFKANSLKNRQYLLKKHPDYFK